MRSYRTVLTRLAAAVSGALLLASQGIAQHALPSWNGTAAKKAIVGFVESVTTQGSPDFVPPAERVATFDNDGTLCFASIGYKWTSSISTSIGYRAISTDYRDGGFRYSTTQHGLYSSLAYHF